MADEAPIPSAFAPGPPEPPKPGWFAAFWLAIDIVKLLAIVEERERNGAYAGLEDLCRRVDLARVNKRMLEALPTPPPDPKPNDPPEAAGGGGTRNGIPMYDFPAKRIVHHLANAN